jgi:hypothetical protein
MKKIFVLLLITFSSFVYSQTTITNGEEVYGTWNVSGSPYIIRGEAIVPEGKTLKIKAGVSVRFETGTETDFLNNRNFDRGFLRVNGTLIAKGKENQRIVFTRNGNSGSWGNIFFDTRSKNSVMSYCKVSNSAFIRSIVSDDNSTGAITFYNSTGTVKNTLIVDNAWTAINCKKGSKPTFYNVTVANNKYGVESNTNSSPEIVNSIIYNNETGFYINGGADVRISYSLFQETDLLNQIYDEGNNIIGKSPKFINQSFGDYHLSSTSPCLKKGKGGLNMGGFPK